MSTMKYMMSELKSQEKRIAELLDERDARDLENIELRRVIATLKVGEQTEGWFVSEIITEDEDERVVARLVSLLRNGGGGTVSSDDDPDVCHWKVGDVVDLIDAEWERLDHPEPEPEPKTEEIATGMIGRYSDHAIASEMAGFHAMDYPDGSKYRLHWQAVKREIEAQTKPKPVEPESKNPYKPRIVCADGFSLSVQASSFHYCLPRENGPEDWWNYYAEVEVGQVRDKDGELFDVSKGGWSREYVLDDGTCAVYSFVPVDDVLEFIASHGGAVSDPSIPNLRIPYDSN